MSAYHVPRGASVEHKHRIPTFRELKSLVGEAEINQIITLKSNTLQRCLAPCRPSTGNWCMNTSVISAVKENMGCEGQAGVNR